MSAADLMKVDLHCHSKASWDCVSEFEDIVVRCKARNIKVQAITDHNEIWGAQALQAMTQTDPDLTIIVGEEIYCEAGEIIGLYLNELIPSGLSALETVQRIKAQGGLVLLPHPFDILKRSHLKSHARQEIIDLVDIVEVFNAHISQRRYNQAAKRWAQQCGKHMSGGSDAHSLQHLGSAYTEVPDGVLETPKQLMEALEHGTVNGTWRHPAATLLSRVLHFSSEHLPLHKKPVVSSKPD
jgi:predicted metal-dependent phosphoesterase TrpH